MFRKLVSTLPFSPAMVGQLGFYTRRLQREQFIRRLGLLFVVLTIAVQCLTLLRPPEPTHATSPTLGCAFNSDIKSNDPACKACAFDAHIWINDKACIPNIARTITATNLSNGQSATAAAAHADDRIQYNLKTTNNSTSKKSLPITILVGDLMEYGTVIDAGGGTFNVDTKNVTWGNVTLNPGQSDIRSFVFQLNSTLPTTPQAVDDTSSYDCVLTSTYGNSLALSVACPASKVIEATIRKLPNASLAVNLILSGFVLLGASYFFARSRLLARELNLVRKDFNVGPM